MPHTVAGLNRAFGWGDTDRPHESGKTSRAARIIPARDAFDDPRSNGPGAGRRVSSDEYSGRDRGHGVEIILDVAAVLDSSRRVLEFTPNRPA